MLRKIFIVKPDSKPVTTHKLFTVVVKFLIMSKIEIINESTSSYRLMNLDFLFL